MWGGPVGLVEVPRRTERGLDMGLCGVPGHDIVTGQGLPNQAGSLWDLCVRSLCRTWEQ